MARGELSGEGGKEKTGRVLTNQGEKEK